MRLGTHAPLPQCFVGRYKTSDRFHFPPPLLLTDAYVSMVNMKPQHLQLHSALRALGIALRCWGLCL